MAVGTTPITGAADASEVCETLSSGPLVTRLKLTGRVPEVPVNGHLCLVNGPGKLTPSYIHKIIVTERLVRVARQPFNLLVGAVRLIEKVWILLVPGLAIAVDCPFWKPQAPVAVPDPVSCEGQC